MAKVGYARVSSKDQDFDLQVEALKGAGCSRVFKEKESGTTTKGRDALAECLEYMRSGDTLLITRIDRLARSLRDLQNLVFELQSKGITLQAIEQPIDTSTAAGNAFLSMLGVFAEFETNIRRERQLEGVAKAKAAGKYKGRKPTARAKSEQILELIGQGMTKKAVAEELGIGVASVYRVLKNT
ncbi:MAG: hypothetical protein methR_P0017 [Methyloprofundus sp.]|nr:MAG: hypothetical protein methR_P0017 [Methyloprofundus sp.]